MSAAAKSQPVSAPGAVMLGTAPRYYAPQVRFYGRVTGLPALLAEKRRFVQRWPERRYQPRPGALWDAYGAARLNKYGVTDVDGTRPDSWAGRRD